MEAQDAHATLLSLVDKLYEGTAAPTGFRPFAEALRSSLGASYAGFVIRTKAGSQVVSDGAEGAFFSDYRAHFHAIDPFCEAVLRLRRDQCSDTKAVIAAAQLQRTEFYNDFLRPRGLEGSLAGIIDGGARQANVVSAFFSRGHGPTKEGCALVARLLPHIRRATRVRAQLIPTNEPHLVGEPLLDQFGCAAFTVRRDGRLLLANTMGSALLANRDGLFLDGFHFTACASGERDVLASEIQQAGVPGRAGAGVIRLRRPSGKPALVVLVSPLAERQSLRERAVLVLARDPNAATTPPPELIARALGLTLAEARVAGLLASGLALKEVAHRLTVSEHTARNQLKSALHKSGATRQLELVRLVLLLQR